MITVQVNDAILEIARNSMGYRYKCIDIKPKENLTNDYVLIVDFSASMQHSYSARPALDSIHQVCQYLFGSVDQLTIVLFGQTADLFTVTKDTYNSELAAHMDGYFENQSNNKLKFNTGGTNPVAAFSKFLQESKSNPNSILNLLFLTDGEFNGMNEAGYKHEWKKLAVEFKKLQYYNVVIQSIGYQGDSLRNIQDMKDAFERQQLNFFYNTIAQSSEIVKQMMSSVGEFTTFHQPVLRLKDEIFVKEGCIYTTEKLFDFQDIDHTTNPLEDVEITIGLREKEIEQKVKKHLMDEKFPELCKQILAEYTPIITELKKVTQTITSPEIQVRIEALEKLLTDLKVVEVQKMVDKGTYSSLSYQFNSISSQDTSNKCTMSKKSGKPATMNQPAPTNPPASSLSAGPTQYISSSWNNFFGIKK